MQIKHGLLGGITGGKGPPSISVKPSLSQIEAVTEIEVGIVVQQHWNQQDGETQVVVCIGFERFNAPSSND